MAILAASLAAVTFGKLGIYSMAQGQGSQELTPEQKSAMCDPNDSFVNTRVKNLRHSKDSIIKCHIPRKSNNRDRGRSTVN
jgi:hypothetical protein